MELQINLFLTAILEGGEWSVSRPIRFTPGTNWVGGWMGPIADTKASEI